MYSGVISRDFKAFNGTKTLFSKHKSGKNFKAKYEEEWGERITLS
jgi:hypothetical protein